MNKIAHLVTKADEDNMTKKCHGCRELLCDIEGPSDDGGRITLRGLKYCRRCTGRQGHGWKVIEEQGENRVPLRDEDGEVVRDLLLCIRGSEDDAHKGRIRNRDRNASRNIWEVVKAMVEGSSRPAYLMRTITKRARKTKFMMTPG